MPIRSKKTELPSDCNPAGRPRVAAKLMPPFLSFLFALSLPSVAMAYVGPGAGITLIGALWAVIIAILLMVGGLVAWPLRALMRRRKKASAPKGNPDESGPEENR